MVDGYVMVRWSRFALRTFAVLEEASYVGET